MLFDLPRPVETALLRTGTVLAPLLFAVRVVAVLVRFRRGGADQPSQPGRTNPDS
ncbi:DUF6332 family protein [Streptomyces sp. NPDC006997]|uniref:DUF6332 family protein n=1 Tax=Streptomyces sp. NPDC006997 TaxID=3155356 RepID=UPI003400C59D